MAKPEKAKPERLKIRLSDEASADIARTILAYEATVRSRTIGQVSSELVMEAVDIDSYPEEVRARLAEIAERSERRAVEKSLAMTE